MDERKLQSSSNRHLITYGSSGVSITYGMCNDRGLLDVDECYTLTQRDLKYTLLHLRTRTVRSAITSMMARFNELYGIKIMNVFGYNGVSVGAEIDNHPGMMLMIESLKKGSPTLDCWAARGDIRKNGRGLLFNYLPGISFKDMTRLQLRNYVAELIAGRVYAVDAGPVQDAGVKSGQSIRGILFDFSKDKPMRRVMKRVSVLEASMNREPSLDGSGEIYAAWNPLMKNLYKLGFTFQDADTRVKALQTAGVLEPFVLIRHMHVPDARLFEKAMHMFFIGVRVYKRKEFFAATTQEIHEFFDLVQADDLGDGQGVEAREQWECALEKARSTRKKTFSK